jgi:hypothetical protein
LPQEVKDYEEYNDNAGKRQRQVTLSVAQHVQTLAQQTGQATRALAQRAMKAFQEKLQQAAGMLENTDRLHTEEALQHTLDIESLQTEVIQSMPNNVQTMEQAGAPDVDQRPSPRPLPRSVRPARAMPASTIGTAD